MFGMSENTKSPRKAVAKKKVFYKARPKPTKTYPDFESRVAQVEDDMWWECARSYIGKLDYSACPAAWTFVVKCSDFWHFRNPADNPAAHYVSTCPDFMKVLACGHYNDLFEYYDLGSFEYRKKHPRKAAKMWLAPRRSSVEGDLMDLWKLATTDTDHALALSQCENGEDVKRLLMRARRELGIKDLVDVYAKGVPAELIVKCKNAGYSLESTVSAYLAGVPEEDLFA